MWFEKSQPRQTNAAEPAPALPADICAFFAAVAPPASLLAKPTAKSSSAPSPAAPVTYSGSEGTYQRAELRIREWLIRQEIEARRNPPQDRRPGP